MLLALDDIATFHSHSLFNSMFPELFTWTTTNEIRVNRPTYTRCGFCAEAVYTHTINQSINQSINQFISLHSTEARATVRLYRIKEKCLKTDLKCVNRWSSSTVQWKRVSESQSSNRETTSSSVQVVPPPTKLCKTMALPNRQVDRWHSPDPLPL